MRHRTPTNESWDHPLAVVCGLNCVKGWREVWGEPRGKWHRNHRPASWIRAAWPSDDADRKLRDKNRDHDRTFMERMRLESPKFNSTIPKLEWKEPARLSEFVDTWLESERDLDRWRKKNPKLADLFDQTFSHRHSVVQLPDGQIVHRLRPIPALPGYSVNAALFGEFVLSPRRNSLGKCSRCGRYFLNFGRYKKKYCEHRCAAHDSSVANMRTKREKEYAKRLSAARRAIPQVPDASPHTEDNWKEVVAAEAGVKRNWVTRAINRGKLEVPKKILKSEAAHKEK